MTFVFCSSPKFDYVSHKFDLYKDERFFIRNYVQTVLTLSSKDMQIPCFTDI